MTLSVQWLTVAMMLASGLGLGALFDGYRVVSGELRFPRWWLPVLDILYWMFSAAVVFRVLYASNNGELRAYVFLGLAAGAVLYYWLFSRTVIRLVKWLIAAAKALVSFAIRLFDLIVVKPLLVLYKLLKVILAFGSALTIFLLKIMLQLVRPFWFLLVWLVRPLVRPLGRLLSPYWERWEIRRRLDKAAALAVNGWHKLVRRKRS